jgi:hypothetical protein
MAAVGLAVLLTGLLTNWFRYGLSLEATLVVACALIALLPVCGISYLAYTRNSIRYLRLDIAAIFLSVVIVLYVHHEAIGGLPAVYARHIEKSPPEMVHTARGPLKYWIELENPFSAGHAEFLVVANGSPIRIPIRVFGEQPVGYASALKGSDWATLRVISEDTAVLTLGARLAAGKQFRVHLTNRTATEVPAGG